MESRKMVLNNSFTGQQWSNRHREQTYGHGERGGEGEMHGESNMETYITICKIDSQREFAVWLRKLKQKLCINLEGWARRSNQSILKGISPGISLEGMMLKLKLQYFGHLMQRVDSLEKTLMLGGTGGRRRRGQPRMRWLASPTQCS